MFLNRRNFYFQNYPYLSTYTQAQIQQYRENAIAASAKLQALREAVFEAQVQQRQVQHQQRLPTQVPSNNNDAVTYVGGAMIDSTCGTPPNGLDFTPYGHVSRPGSTPQSYSLWGSSKGSQAESDEHLYRKRFGKSLCRVVTTCAVVLVVLALLGIIGIAVYLGYISNQEDGGDPNHTSKFVGNVHIIKGDTWVPELHYSNSPPFRAKATKYKNMLQSVYEHSSLGPAIESAEITSFKEISPRSKGFEMTFVLNLDKRKIPFWYIKSVEAELKKTLLQELGSLSPVAFQNVKADLESLTFKKFETEIKVQDSLIAKPNENLQLLNVGGVGGILRVKSSDVQPVAGKEIGEIFMTVKQPRPTSSKSTSEIATKPTTAKETTSPTTVTTTTMTTTTATTPVTNPVTIPNPTTLRNLVYEHGPWRPIFIGDGAESETKKTKLRRPNEESQPSYYDVFDFPHFSVVEFPDFQSGENETEFLYPPLDIGVIDDPVIEGSFLKPQEFPYPPLDIGVVDEVPSRDDRFKYGPILDGHFESTTSNPFSHPITGLPAEESQTISAGVIREFLRTLFTTEAPAPTKLSDKVSNVFVTTQSPSKKENIIEEVTPSRKDIQSVLENLFYLASFNPDKHKQNKTFEMSKLWETEGKYDLDREFLPGDEQSGSIESTTSSSSQNVKSKFTKLPYVTSYSGVRDFQRPRPPSPSPNGMLPLDRFRINAQSSTPEQPNLIPLKGKPFHLNIWDMMTTEKPLILDTEVVTSTSYDVHYGATTEELRPVYIHSSTLRTLTNIINDNSLNQLTIPVISGKEVTYVRVNRTRPNYPKVVIVNMPPDSLNKTDILGSEKDGRNIRFNTKFLNDISKLINFETTSKDGNNNTSINKNSREGKPININANFLEEPQKSEANNTSIWSMLSNLSKVYLSDPAILQQLYQFATSTKQSSTNTNLVSDLKDRTQVTGFDPQTSSPQDFKRRKSGKSLKFPSVTTLFISKDANGANSKVISMSNRSPKVSSVASKTNSPIHTFTFKEDQSLDELLAEIFDVLSNEDSNLVHDVSSNTKDRQNFKFSSSSVPAGEDSLKIIEELSKLLSDHYGSYSGVFGPGSTEPEEQEVQETTHQPIEETTSTVAATIPYEIDTPMSSEVTDTAVETTTKLVEATKHKYSTKRPSSHKYYHDLFPAMTRPMNPIKTTTPQPLASSSEKTSVDVSYSFKSGEVMTEFHKDLKTNRNCTELEFRCRNGNCIPLMARCNMIKDCSDNSDEQTCKCSDILKSQHYVRKICDGIIDCWDKSDEINCDWCGAGKFICTGYRQCVEPENVCDGVPDCPNGEDERDCVTISPNDIDASHLEYFNEGYLMVRKNGLWGKLCFDKFEKTVAKAGVSWSVADLGEAVCNTLTFDSFRNVENLTDTTPHTSRSADPKYYEIDITSDSRSKSRLRSLDLSTHINAKRSLSNILSGDFLRNELTHELKGSLKTFASLLKAIPLSENHRTKRDSTDFDLSLQFQGTDCPDKNVVKVNCAELQCGVRPRATTLQARIVGGSNSSPGAWPWHAALYKEGEYQCGATLISPDWLISAGHCFYSAKHEYWVARMGALRRGTKFPSPFEQVRPIRQIFIHPDYVNQGFINDVSLLRLEDSVRLNDYVRPVCLPSPGSEVNDGESCTLVGWGQLFEVKKVFPDTLQEVEVPVISTKECRKRTVFLPLYRITEDMFCAGYDRGGRDACLGDSGGPLMCQKSDGRWEVIGVTSNGYGCARPHRPGVYTKVANYLPWINQVMELGSSGRIVPLKKQCSGLRCPLGECLSPMSICNGKIECSDGSDEKNCS